MSILPFWQWAEAPVRSCFLLSVRFFIILNLRMVPLPTFFLPMLMIGLPLISGNLIALLPISAKGFRGFKVPQSFLQIEKANLVTVTASKIVGVPPSLLELINIFVPCCGKSSEPSKKDQKGYPC